VPNIAEDTDESLVYKSCGNCEPCKKEKMMDIYTNKTFKLMKSTNEISVCYDDMPVEVVAHDDLEIKQIVNDVISE
jgi:hypothetical protein